MRPNACGPPPSSHCLYLTTTAFNFHKDPEIKEEINRLNPHHLLYKPFTFLPTNKPPSSSPLPFKKPKAMDWYSWLSKSNLEHDLIYEYSLLFSHNELEEEDIIHFSHEFLQSMGISIAKHRLEILKLAKRSNSPHPVARLLAAMKKTKKCLAKYIHSLVHRDKSAIVVVPRPSNGGARWKGAMLKRNKRLALLKKERLMLTDGGVKFARPNSFTQSPSPVVAYNNQEREKGGDEDGCWGNSTEEIRWDTMFQDLKPT